MSINNAEWGELAKQAAQSIDGIKLPNLFRLLERELDTGTLLRAFDILLGTHGVEFVAAPGYAPRSKRWQKARRWEWSANRCWARRTP